jgi:hypothetical protein
MVRTVERIEQEIAVLDRSLETIAQEFRDSYRQYLTALGQAVKQQLILAAYYLCTQGYPERFLKLSLHQRQELQRSLRQVAQQSQQRFLEMLNGSQWVEDTSPRRSVVNAKALIELSKIALGESSITENGEVVLVETNLSDEDLAAMDLSATDFSATGLARSDLDAVFRSVTSEDDPESDSQENNSQFGDPQFSDLQENNPQSSEAQSEQPQEPHHVTPSEAEVPSNAEQDAAQSDAPTVAEILDEVESAQPNELRSENLRSKDAPLETAEPGDPQPHPKRLAYWQERLEEKIVEELQTLSHSVNRLLQQAEILPSRLPEPVLEVAARADLASETAASPPNLLNLIVETESDESKESSMTQLMAVRLRLSEIEFSDSSAMVGRSKIRELLARLNKLGREYQKKQKERSIAQAEAAWRSSWYEEKE